MILEIIGGITCGFVAIFVLKLLVSYKNLDYYRQQGVETSFYPILGFFKLLCLPKDMKDQLFKFKELVRTKLDKPMFVCNQSNFGGSFVFLLDTDLI